MNDATKEHWEAVHTKAAAENASWYEPIPTQSLALIRAAGVPTAAPILDVGGGASTLVDHLIDEGYTDVTVLDIAPRALEQSRQRLRDAANRVTWIEADILELVPARQYAVWHDRAVFHFLTDASDRVRYVQQARRVVCPGGFVLVATFAEDGPTRCSGLDVVRYSVTDLHAAFGADFNLVQSKRRQHRTPDGIEQSFVYCLCRYEPNAAVPLYANANGAKLSRK